MAFKQANELALDVYLSLLSSHKSLFVRDGSSTCHNNKSRNGISPFPTQRSFCGLKPIRQLSDVKYKFPFQDFPKN
jgi:hypothetical protein